MNLKPQVPNLYAPNLNPEAPNCLYPELHSRSEAWTPAGGGSPPLLLFFISQPVQIGPAVEGPNKGDSQRAQEPQRVHMDPIPFSKIILCLGFGTRNLQQRGFGPPWQSLWGSSWSLPPEDVCLRCLYTWLIGDEKTSQEIIDVTQNHLDELRRLAGVPGRAVPGHAWGVPQAIRAQGSKQEGSAVLLLRPPEGNDFLD